MLHNGKNDDKYFQTTRDVDYSSSNANLLFENIRLGDRYLYEIHAQLNRITFVCCRKVYLYSTIFSYSTRESESFSYIFTVKLKKIPARERET